MKTVRSFLQGVALGVAIILPGLSGGTAALVMGLYHGLLHDFSHFRWRPYIPLGVGVGAGILGGARATAWLLDRVPSLLSAFLLGVVLASAWAIFRRQRGTPPLGLAAWGLGAALAFLAAVEPLAPSHPAAGGEAIAPRLFIFLGGSLASAAMMLPGMSGGTLLIMMGQYNDMLAALNQGNIPILAVFAAGAVLGMFVVSRLVSTLMNRYPVAVGFFLAGMILGSARAVWPGQWGVGEILALAGGAGLVALGGEDD